MRLGCNSHGLAPARNIMDYAIRHSGEKRAYVAFHRVPERTNGASGSSDEDQGRAMKFLSLLIVATFTMTVASHALSQQLGPVPNGCVKDLSGKISCPPVGGEVHVNLSGQAVCGKGRCVRDLSGKITCSSLPAGQIAQDVNGKIMCAGSCEEASASYCQVLQ